MATLKIKNIDRLTRKLNNIADMDLNKSMTDAVKLVHGNAKSLAPVNKRGGGGTLAESIHMDVDKKADQIIGRVYTNLEYAMYVEFGTGVKGNGTYPYDIEGVNLTYKDSGWCYWDEKEEKWIYTTGQVAQPYMYPALKNNEKAIKKLFNTGVIKELTEICKGGQ